MAENTGLSSSDVSAGDDATATQHNNLRTDIKKMRQESLTAGETINGATLPVPVFQNTTDNEFYACDADDVTRLVFTGFAITNGVDAGAIIIQHTGVVGGFSGLQEGEKYYVQDTVGTIGTTQGSNEILVGVAISTTQLLIEKESSPSGVFFLGTGVANIVKDYYNFSIPLLLETNVFNDIWDGGSTIIQTAYGGAALTLNNGDIAWRVFTSNPVFLDVNSESGLSFADSKKVIVEFGAKMKTFPIGNDDNGFGLAASFSGLQTFSATADMAGFVIDKSSGVLYSKTAGVGVTTTTISGVTITDMNTYRIEFDPSVDVKFYVNGVLKATHTTNLPVVGFIHFGWAGTGNYNGTGEFVSGITQPFFTIEK